MNRNWLSLALACTLALVLASTMISRADDKAKADAPKPAASTATTYSVCCQPPCDFCITGNDKAEVAAIVKAHAKTHHHMDLTDKDVDAMIKVCEPKK